MTSPSAAPLAVLLLLAACTPTGHPVVPSALGTPRDAAALLAVVDLPGPVKLEEIVAADWAVPREGLWNLDSPKAKAAGLSPGLEPAQLTFQALRHPTQGLFIVDTGVERAMRDIRARTKACSGSARSSGASPSAPAPAAPPRSTWHATSESLSATPGRRWRRMAERYQAKGMPFTVKLSV